MPLSETLAKAELPSPKGRGRDDECRARGAERAGKQLTPPNKNHALPLRNEFGVEVGAEPLDAAFAAVARLLDAAERRLRRGDGDRIDADHARLHRLADRRRGRVRAGE